MRERERVVATKASKQHGQPSLPFIYPGRWQGRERERDVAATAETEERDGSGEREKSGTRERAVATMVIDSGEIDGKLMEGGWFMVVWLW
jgi:hypothetical protein